MATNDFVLGILCLALTHSSGMLTGNPLTIANIGANQAKVGLPIRNINTPKAQTFAKGLAHWTAKVQNRRVKATKLLLIASAQIGVRETTGHNDGEQVESYLRYTGNQKGEPWCASFVSWVFGVAGYKQPRTAWSPALLPIEKQITLPAVASVFGIYFPQLKRIAHCGIVEKQHHSWLSTIEGNTNAGGSRDGDGVYRKLRHTKTIKYYADWLLGDGEGNKP